MGYQITGYDYEIQYKLDSDNVVTYTLSRHPVVSDSIEGYIDHLGGNLQCKEITYPYCGRNDELRMTNENKEWIFQKKTQC